jgi:putative tryptophan/tyrosine transport system substrate-binding protein
MNRRAFVTGLGGVLAAPRIGEGQQRAAIGVIDANAPLGAARFYPPFWQRLSELGWSEGKTLSATTRGAGGEGDRIETLAAEFARLKVNVIVMDNGTFAQRVGEKVTRTIPICVAGGDLQSVRAVTNLAKPESNITGVQVLQPDLAGKRLALLKEIIPDLSRAGILVQGRDAPSNIAVLRSADDAARRLGIQLRVLEAQHSDAVDRSFSLLTNAGARGLVVVNNPAMLKNRQQIIALAAKTRLVTIYEYRDC